MLYYNMTGYVWRSICSPSCPCKWLLSGTKQCVKTGKMHNDSYWGESSRLKQSVTKDSQDPQEHCFPVWRPPRHYFPSFNLSKFFLNPCKHLIPTESYTMSLCCLSLLLKHLLFIMNLRLLTSFDTHMFCTGEVKEQSHSIPLLLSLIVL